MRLLLRRLVLRILLPRHRLPLRRLLLGRLRRARRGLAVFGLSRLLLRVQRRPLLHRRARLLGLCGRRLLDRLRGLCRLRGLLNRLRRLIGGSGLGRSLRLRRLHWLGFRRGSGGGLGWGGSGGEAAFIAGEPALVVV